MITRRELLQYTATAAVAGAGGVAGVSERVSARYLRRQFYLN